MGEIERIAEQWKRTSEGESWTGPTLSEVLADVTAEQAAARPVAGAHSIREIVQHLIAWTEIVTWRLEGAPWKVLPPEEDWPPVDEEGPPAWSATVERLALRGRELRGAIAALPETRLAEILPGSQDDFYVLLHGALQHDYYHAGQIGLLKRALAEPVD